MHVHVHYVFNMHFYCLITALFQGISLEKKEARAEKEEADKYKKLTQELVSPVIKEHIMMLLM